ncbi:hypothetical protein JCM10207_008928 [Rhodosporidiobolus poonsookiae]
MVTVKSFPASSAQTPAKSLVTPRPLQRLHSFFVKHQSPAARGGSTHDVGAFAFTALLCIFIFGGALLIFEVGPDELSESGELLSAGQIWGRECEAALLWLVRTACFFLLGPAFIVAGWALYLGISLLVIVCSAYLSILLYWTYSTRIITRDLYTGSPSIFKPVHRLIDYLLPPFLLFHLASPSSFRSLAEPYLPYFWTYLAFTSLFNISLPHLLLGLAAWVDAAIVNPGGIEGSIEGVFGSFSVRFEGGELQKVREELREVKEELRRMKENEAKRV